MPSKTNKCVRVQTGAACRRRHTCICNSTPQRQPGGGGGGWVMPDSCNHRLSGIAGGERRRRPEIGGFYGRRSVPNPLAFSLGSPTTCAGLPGPWLTCSLQATESVLSPQKRLTAKFTKITATCAPSGLSLTGDYNRVVSVTPSLPPPPSSLHPLQNTQVSFIWTSRPLNDGLKAPFGRASRPASSHA